jgi:hypothetical protein
VSGTREGVVDFHRLTARPENFGVRRMSSRLERNPRARASLLPRGYARSA